MKDKKFPSSSMSDIAFLLLLFFLILAITTKTTPFPIDEAESPTYEELTERYPVLYVDKTGTISYHDKIVTIDQIPQEEELCLMADKATPYGILSPIISRLHEQGTTTIHCLVEASYD